MTEEKDLVSFGKYLLSEKREKRLKSSPGVVPYKERFRDVHDADIANWRDEQGKVKDLNYEIKVFEIARLEPGRLEELICDYPVSQVYFECPVTPHVLTGVHYFIEGNSVFVSIKGKSTDHIYVKCIMEVPVRNVEDFIE